MRPSGSLPNSARRLAFALMIFCAGAIQAANAQAPTPTVASTLSALRAHDYPKALEMAEALVRATPQDPRPWTLQGMALFGLGQPEEALRAYRRALELKPDYLAALEGAGQLEYQSGSPQAKDTLERVLRIDPTNETAHAMLASLAFKHKECTEVVPHYEHAQSAIAKNPSALVQFGICLVDTHKLAEAGSVFERLLALQPDNLNNRYNLGLIQYLNQQYELSIQTLQPLVNGATPEEEALNLIAADYEATSETAPAVSALRRAIAAAPRDPKNYLDLTTLCLDHYSFQVGVDVATAGLKELPASAELYAARGVLYAQLLKYDEAEADFETANRLRPQQTFATMGLGIALLESNDSDRSLQVIRERLAKSPDDPSLNYLLAEVLNRRNASPGTPEFSEALRAASRAVRVKPDFVVARDVLSGLYLKSGNLKESVVESRLALKQDPDDRTAVYHLIEALRKSGDTSEVPALVARMQKVVEAEAKNQAKVYQFRLVEPEHAGANPPS